jgi:hypothetical protein
VDGLVSPHHLGAVGPGRLDGGAGRRQCSGGAQKGGAARASIGQSGAIQSPAGTRIRLSVPEIRRLLWRVVLAVGHPAEHILAWSQWRRQHQAGAKYWHYKRRGALDYLQL